MGLRKGPHALGVLLAVTHLAIALPATAQRGRDVTPDQVAGLRTCKALFATLDDPTRDSWETRDGPSLDAKVTGKMVQARKLTSRPVAESKAPGFAIIATKDGWLRTADSDERATPSDWIRGEGIVTETAATAGYSRPSDSSEMLVESRDGSRLDGHAKLIDIIACDGAWTYGRWRITEPDKLAYSQPIELWDDPTMIEMWTRHCASRIVGWPIKPHMEVSCAR